MYKPKEINRLHTAAELLKPFDKEYNGVHRKGYPESGDLIYVNFKSKGGTESVVNGVYSIIETAQVVTWWREDIKADCRIKIGNDTYEVKADPEDVEMQHMYMIVKLQKVGGGA